MLRAVTVAESHKKDASPRLDAPLQVSDVHYSYGKTRAVNGVSFSVGPGEVFGLLGPNGAGKTTTISMIAGLLRPESGQVLIFGDEASDRSGRARARMGVVPQDIALYEELSVRENLRFWGQIYGLSGSALTQAVENVMRDVGLTERARDRVAALSGGLKRRANLAAGLVHTPDLLLLDEPTVGIDPQARIRILDVVKAQADAGRAVVYTSHYLEEAEQICDRLAIVDHGAVLAIGTVGELQASGRRRSRRASERRGEPGAHAADRVADRRRGAAGGRRQHRLLLGPRRQRLLRPRAGAVRHRRRH